MPKKNCKCLALQNLAVYFEGLLEYGFCIENSMLCCLMFICVFGCFVIYYKSERPVIFFSVFDCFIGST